MRAENKKKNRQKYFHNCATKIQSAWRAYKSRQADNFWNRKKRLKEIEQKGEEYRAKLAEKSQRDNAVANQKNKEKAEQEFKSQTSKLHYLLSTEITPGIFHPQRMGRMGAMEEVIKQNRPQSLSLPKIGSTKV